MNLREKAQGAPYHLVTTMKECPLGRFWVVQLSAGFEVYQTNEDQSLDEPSPWMRLKKFCEDYDVKPMNMAFANKELDPTTQINLDPLADAYFYSRRVRKLMAAHPGYAGYEDISQGVGELHKNTLKIIWELDDGRLDVEQRSLDEHPKSRPISLIYKN